MSTRRISQREARMLKARVRQLEQRYSRLRRFGLMEDAWVGGKYIATEPNVTDAARVAINTARRLGHAVFVDARDIDKEIRFFAVEVQS